MRVVLDTNVLLADVGTHGLCEGILAIAFRDHAVVFLEYILDELAEHYVGKFKATEEQAVLVVTTFRHQGEMVVAIPSSVTSSSIQIFSLRRRRCNVTARTRVNRPSRLQKPSARARRRTRTRNPRPTAMPDDAR